MHYGIDGRSALIVGGSKGIGFEVAKMLAAEGARVAVMARTKTDVDAAVEAIREQSGTAIGVTADVSNSDQLGDAVREVTAQHGPPLIVVGQSKYQRPGDFADITDVNVYRESFESHTMSQILLLQAVLPAMQEAGWGRFVHVGSATAKEPAGNIHHAVANTSRPSTIGMLKTVADEYAQYGITVNTVAPGWIETDNALAYLENHLGASSQQERREFMLKQARVPAARMGRPDEIASLIAYLCSEAAGYVTGSWIEVDGGLHRSAF
ncbi:SDR family oxidoreductase [Mycolicibacterium monacense]|uniref:3-oxoacyl-[acyl-carrier-protein] reductase MabA n=2 Tax=Mycobacteriaceae TaxID=1762 RepID=A0AAD1MWP8_MYCMB|nr:SDR family oxidoreductase [Mycolicibacterium monacense]MDA4104789.1 short-chain dehydrogenase [Mycolicibacterium monacense DSM 44395]ORB22804.1 short-chain dehydrogenase [Mycolicibacterium monacense DSM 44395]QHP87690.1 SDR family oxidoreductase [Mycolicibacterium monacense DSM 44395]BBZ59139.1 3-oxoacyl-ACP reductase [Mycolicibacterium monacense]